MVWVVPCLATCAYLQELHPNRGVSQAPPSSLFPVAVFMHTSGQLAQADFVHLLYWQEQQPSWTGHTHSGSCCCLLQPRDTRPYPDIAFMWFSMSQDLVWPVLHPNWASRVPAGAGVKPNLPLCSPTAHLRRCSQPQVPPSNPCFYVLTSITSLGMSHYIPRGKRGFCSVVFITFTSHCIPRDMGEREKKGIERGEEEMIWWHAKVCSKENASFALDCGIRTGNKSSMC